MKQKPYGGFNHTAWQEGALRAAAVDLDPESANETPEILNDQVFADRLRESIQQAKDGKTVSLETAEARLRL